MVWFYLWRPDANPESIHLLSIPLWSDFITKTRGNIQLSWLHFQSHYGLILSAYIKPVNLSPGKPFNPTMVWFYRRQRGIYRSVQGCFQSHYGLILSEFPEKSLFSTCFTFNPTMVWFYHGNHGLHYWTNKKLSIPLWSDFITTPFIVFELLGKDFQSHYGLILSSLNT